MTDSLSPSRLKPVLIKRSSVVVKVCRGRMQDYETCTLAYYEAGQRVQRTFPSLAAAKVEAKIVATRLDQADALAPKLTGADRQQYLLATGELKAIGIPLHLAVWEFVAAKNILGEGSLLDAAKLHRPQPSAPKRRSSG